MIDLHVGFQYVDAAGRTHFADMFMAIDGKLTRDAVQRVRATIESVVESKTGIVITSLTRLDFEA